MVNSTFFKRQYIALTTILQKLYHMQVITTISSLKKSFLFYYKEQ